ncbi:symmetrical bis(5'-nucleosyl)-tetraphosphatase [Pseudomonadota bacterium]
MATYAIGDVQGCYNELQQLLEKIKFNPADDTLWFVGDLVNRGPHSLEVLRFVKGLGSAAVTVLGNHDLHLLAISQGNARYKDKAHTLDPILNADDREELIDWLRSCPLMHHDARLNFSMLHGGLPPQWDLSTALGLADEMHNALTGPGFHDYCQQMYGNKPAAWSDDLQGMERLRFITNCMTRMRYCDQKGRPALKEKGAPGSQENGYLPWFEHPHRATRKERIVFGHWSTLGYHKSENVWSIDTGCLWGGSLTALKLRKKKKLKPTHLACPAVCNPG